MNRIKQLTLYIIIFLWVSINFIYAEQWVSTSKRQGNPMQMLDNFAHKVNKEDRIQDTALNDISNIQWQYASEYKITNTLDSIRIQIAPYIQWTMYIWLSLAVLWIIYNGFLMVTNSIHENGTSEKVKNRIINICIGVGLLTWFYIIIQLLLASISYILK
jgi:hypothetical protein